MPRWRLGARYDRLGSSVARIEQVANGMLGAADFPVLAPYQPSIAAAMVDWSPSEFSRLRLQYARDRSRPDVIDHQVFLQYIMSFGAHGAHAWQGHTMIRRFCMMLIALTVWQQSHAAIEVFACEPEWGALIAELAGDNAKVYVATTAAQDVH